MLVGFSFKNFRSFYDDTSFHMEANSTETNLRELNTIEMPHGELLKSAVVFGANASGKSNFMRAFKYMKEVIISDGVNQRRLINAIELGHIFTWSEEQMEISFEISFIFADELYRYGFAILNGEVNEEYLYHVSNDVGAEEMLIFERTSPDFKDISFGSDTVMPTVRNLTSNTKRTNLFLYVANTLNDDLAANVCLWFERTKENVSISGDERLDYTNLAINYLQKSERNKEDMLKMIKLANPLIESLDIDKDGNYKVRLSQREYTKEGRMTQVLRGYPLDYESEGTQLMFGLSVTILNVLENGSTLFIDEIDSSLHPLLVRHILNMFNSIDQNPKGAQLICTTHDALLLEENLRRDQIYFTEKNEQGRSELYSLIDFKNVENTDKILKRYLVGSYGGVPKLREHLELI